MVKITIRGPIAARLGNRQIEIQIKNPTKVLDILQRLIDENEEVRNLWLEVQTMDREALILRNDADIGLSGGLETNVYNEETIVILPLIHGG